MNRMQRVRQIIGDDNKVNPVEATLKYQTFIEGEECDDITKKVSIKRLSSFKMRNLIEVSYKGVSYDLRQYPYN